MSDYRAASYRPPTISKGSSQKVDGSKKRPIDFTRSNAQHIRDERKSEKKDPSNYQNSTTVRQKAVAPSYVAWHTYRPSASQTKPAPKKSSKIEPTQIANERPASIAEEIQAQSRQLRKLEKKVDELVQGTKWDLLAILGEVNSARTEQREDHQKLMNFIGGALAPAGTEQSTTLGPLRSETGGQQMIGGQMGTTAVGAMGWPLGSDPWGGNLAVGSTVDPALFPDISSLRDESSVARQIDEALNPFRSKTNGIIPRESVVGSKPTWGSHFTTGFPQQTTSIGPLDATEE